MAGGLMLMSLLPTERHCAVEKHDTVFRVAAEDSRVNPPGAVAAIRLNDAEKCLAAARTSSSPSDAGTATSLAATA